MTADEVKRLYDSEYAASYESKFIHSELTAADARYELELLRSFLRAGDRWLDVACGTGYFLRQFPQIERAGLDLSAGMLERARAANPGVELVEHDYRVPIPRWENRFDLVSCMWYAYGYAETIPRLLELIRNLATWTAPTGRCFMPLADPDRIARVPMQYHLPNGYGGDVTIVGVLWSYAEENGTKVHANMLAPNMQFMCERFGEYFERVEIIEYPPARPGMLPRPALVATGKRSPSA